jgi:hypothetical protein
VTNGSSWAELLAEAEVLIDDAARQGMTFRALGSAAVRMHCPPADIALAAVRRSPKDIDLVCRKEDRRKVRSFFADRGYEIDRDVLVAMEGSRYIFRHPETAVEVDLWVDTLEFCHTIDVRKRLTQGERTLTIEDLLLSKLQIVELTTSDRLDLACILATHPVVVGGASREEIDSRYVAEVLAADWGFWKTATSNLDGLVADPDGDQNAVAGAKALLQAVAAIPKTVKWRLRSRVGERMQWWREVGIPRDTY